MITTIIFDADGVLINGERFSDVLARDYEVDHEKEREFFTTTFQDCLVGKAHLGLKKPAVEFFAKFYEGYEHFRQVMKERYGFDMMGA